MIRDPIDQALGSSIWRVAEREIRYLLLGARVKPATSLNRHPVGLAHKLASEILPFVRLGSLSLWKCIEAQYLSFRDSLASFIQKRK